MKQLEYVLRRLGNVSELWCLPSFGKMWQAVITAPLNKGKVMGLSYTHNLKPRYAASWYELKVVACCTSCHELCWKGLEAVTHSPQVEATS